MGIEHTKRMEEMGLMELRRMELEMAERAELRKREYTMERLRVLGPQEARKGRKGTEGNFAIEGWYEENNLRPCCCRFCCTASTRAEVHYWHSNRAIKRIFGGNFDC